MKLISFMMNVDKNLKRIEFLDKGNYKKGTILGEDNKEFWVTYTHYRVNNKRYRLGFSIVDLSDKDYEVYILDSEKEPINKLTSISGKGIKIFYDSNDNNDPDVGSNASGVFYVGVFENGERIYVSPPIYVLPSSLSYNDYLEMINDLIQINEHLIEDNKSKVFLAGKGIQNLVEIGKTLDDMKKVLEKINVNPAASLKAIPAKIKYDPKKAISPKILVEKKMYPFKNKFKGQMKVESVDIYENKIIKYLLNLLKKKIELYIQSLNNYKEQKKREIEIIREQNKQEIDFDSELEKLEKILIDNKKNILNIIKNNKNLENIDKDKDIKISFDIYKKASIPKSRINGKIEDNKIILDCDFITTRENRFISLERGFYFYAFSPFENFQFSKFNAETFKLKIEITNLNELIFFIEEVIESDNLENLIKIEALAKREDHDINDPLCMGSLDYKYRNTSEYYINIKKIYSLNEKEVPEYSEEEIVEKLAPYLNDNYESIVENKRFLELYKKRENSLRCYDDKINELKKAKSRLDEILNLDLFKEVKEEKLILKPTQIFTNDNNYKKIWQYFNVLNKKIYFIHNFIDSNMLLNEKSYLIKSTHEIYEYWTFFKMIDVLISELKWRLKNKNEVLNNLNKYIQWDYFQGNLKAKLEHDLKNNEKIDLVIYFNKNIKSNDGKILRPDFTFEFRKDNRNCIVYLDAKYRNYREQGKEQWFKDIKDVAIDKYTKKFRDTENEPIASFIVHPDTNNEWTFYGGYLDNKLEKKFDMEGIPPEHKFGIFAFTPNNIQYFKNFIKMILEYHLELYNYCWNCGEIDNIEIKVEKTMGGFNKYHYTCKSCGEFWVKNHCEKEGHSLIKHLFNYHTPDTDKKYPWYVKCPRCGKNDNGENTTVFEELCEFPTFDPNIL
ncbi:nuclease domain-containing protein [Marinitoga sp. 1138]|uniref:nuclease domain-containing protein n=1 Tax=Marinitoga sp. 1138 TaxID=1643334 RepID=UPI00158605FD|nr:nuclease domain-containing protein [Marinitoga sp. 1138]NUU97730.1 hypothetical protein [Marinitoga sp. 1138]